MSIPDDGGTAFPNQEDENNFSTPGMSLRDWFAGQALAGEMVASSEGVWSNNIASETLEDRALLLWRFADAMIATRNKDAALPTTQEDQQ